VSAPDADIVAAAPLHTKGLLGLTLIEGKLTTVTFTVCCAMHPSADVPVMV
jgi:hypothetical protein